ncbi:chromosome segregation ATPase [Vibrio sinus]
MNYRFVLGGLTVIVGIYLWLEKEVRVEPSVSAKAQKVTSFTKEVSRPLGSPPIDASGAVSERGSTSLSMSRLNHIQGRELVMALESFWQECQRLSDCADKLTTLEPQLADSRYQLFLRYPSLIREWQQVWGDTELNKFSSLSDKVAEFKRLAALVWGEFAEQIFADELTFYDFSLGLQNVSNGPAEDFAEGYQAYLDKWQNEEVTLELQNNSAKYDKGVSLIPDTYSFEQVQVIKHQLAQQYLSAQEIQSIASRERQIVEQDTQVNQYQIKLSELQTSLEQQRLSTRLSDTEWQTYAEQQISQFRRDYFTFQ